MATEIRRKPVGEAVATALVESGDVTTAELKDFVKGHFDNIGEVLEAMGHAGKNPFAGENTLGLTQWYELKPDNLLTYVWSKTSQNGQENDPLTMPADSRMEKIESPALARVFQLGSNVELQRRVMADLVAAFKTEGLTLFAVHPEGPVFIYVSDAVATKRKAGEI